MFVDLNVGKEGAATLLELSSFSRSSILQSPELPPAIAGKALRRAPLLMRKYVTGGRHLFPTFTCRCMSRAAPARSLSYANRTRVPPPVVHNFTSQTKLAFIRSLRLRVSYRGFISYSCTMPNTWWCCKSSDQTCAASFCSSF